MKARSTGRALRRFGFCQTVRGALILGVIGGLMMGAQGAAYAAAYPDEQSRAGVVALLGATPALNFMAGEIKNAAEPASYAVYKSLPMMVIITSVWGLMVVTRLLRGNEEDGRMELLLASKVSRRRASSQLLAGFGYSFLVSMACTWIIIALLGRDPAVNLSVGSSLLLTLAVFLPGAFFASLGVVTSQLTVTRGRAILYGLVPLIILFVVRGAGSMAEKLDWLKSFTPFGWSDRLNPVLDPQAVWILPTIGFAAVFTGLGLYWVGKRDYATGLISSGDMVRSRFALLGSVGAFTARQSIGKFAWWTLGTVFFTGFIAWVAGMVADILRDSSLQSMLAAVSSDTIKRAFIGYDMMLLGMVLLVMTILGVAALRRDEAKGYLDNFLVRRINRRTWLGWQLGATAIIAFLITLIAVTVMWLIAAGAQHIDVSFGSMLASGVAVAGCVVLLLGVGAFLYGVWPRLAVFGMAIVAGWALVVDILKDLFDLDDWVGKTSLLAHIPSDPATTPDWTAVTCLWAIGILLIIAGVAWFGRRDITQE